MGDALTDVERAAAALASGGVVVIPTDTVYGLAARADDAAAIDRIYALKARSRDKELQLLIPDVGWLDRLSRPSAAARRLAERFWPGPLTIILSGLQEESRVGLRVPAHAVALDLLGRVGAVAATSANRSGEPTPADVAAIRDLFGNAVDVYLDGGTIAGAASTVVDLTGAEPEIVREGNISAADIAHALEGRFEGH